MSAEEKFREALRQLPAPGSGACHRALLGAANHGVRAGLDDAAILVAIRAALPSGTRPVPDAEIRAAIAKARRDAGTQPTRRAKARYLTSAMFAPRTRTPAIDWDAARERIIAVGGGEVDPYSADLWEASPIRLTWGLEVEAAEFLRLMYEPQEYVFIGNRHSTGQAHCRTAEEWCRIFTAHPPDEEYALLVPNPVTGQPAPTKDGKPSYRALSALAERRYAVLEFDRADMPPARQLPFWRGMRLPNAAAVIDSGGKSLHLWLRFAATDPNAWNCSVKPIFGKLAAMGVDRAGDTGGQMCRLPGVRRAETGRWQRLLWLCPDGGILP